ncbi:MAG: RDD family protein, partial [Thermoplasmata archaeon]
PGELANDIAGNVALLAFPAVLWALIYLLAWEHGAFATSIGFGRRTFWLLLPGALLASFVLLPVTPVANDWLAVSFAGALFPLLVASLAFRQFAPPAARSVTLYVALLVAMTGALLLVVVEVTPTRTQLIALVVVAAAVPLALGASAWSTHRALFGRVAFVLGLTSGVIVSTFLASTAIPGVGIEEAFPVYLLPPVGAGAIAALAAGALFPRAESLSLPVAYASATFGVLVGADVLRQPPLYAAGSPAGLYAIGGAGVLDLVYLSGLLALGAAYVAHRMLGRGLSPAGTPAPDPAPTPFGQLGRAFRAGVDGRIDLSLQDAAAAGRAAAAQAHHLLELPDPPPDRPWQGLPVPGWVVSDQANLDSAARAGSTDGREGFRAFLTARWLVLLGRELGVRRFGSAWARTAAFAIDLTVVAAPAVLLWVYFLRTTPGSADALATNVAFNASVFGFAAIAFFYFALAETLDGRTVGKALVGLAVRDRWLGRPGLSAALLRNSSKLPTLTVLGVGLAFGLLLLVKPLAGPNVTAGGGPIVPAGVLDFVTILAFVVGGIGFLGAFGVLAIALTSERQRFGDLVAGTWVLRSTPPTAAAAVPPGPSGGPPVPPPPGSAGGRSG